MKPIVAMSIFLILSGCGGDGGSSSGASSATRLIAKEIAIDDNNTVMLSFAPQKTHFLFDLLIPQALAASFVNMEPFFAPYYQNIPLEGSTPADIKKEITIFPRISKDSNDDGVDDTGLVYFVDQIGGQNVFYHLVVQRKGGAIADGQQNLVIKIKDSSNADVTTTVGNECYVTIANVGEDSLARGDIILETHDHPDNAGSYISTPAGCRIEISGNFGAVTIAEADPKIVNLKGIKDSVTGTYPQMTAVSFNDEDVVTEEVSIEYNSFPQIGNYRYANWEITSTSGTEIRNSFWMFTCGGGGQATWINTTGGSFTGIISNTYETASFDGYTDIYATTPLKFPWRVGGCSEMLMMISAADTNGVMTQKKVAIISQ